MIKSFTKKITVSIIIFTIGISLAAQNKEYRLNDEKSEVTILVDKEEKSTFTIDNILRKEQGRPAIESRLYNMNINMDTVGVWSQLSSKENVWKLQVDAPDAKVFFISFDDFYLPTGSKLYVYNKNNFKNAILYKPEDNPQGGPYSIEDLYGGNVVLEYVSPKNSNEKPRFHFSAVGYKYIEGLIETDEKEYIDSTQPCMININCPQGVNWQVQKKGVVYLRMHQTGGSTANQCTGTLINNTAEDKKPYILTANHCFENVDVSKTNNIEVLFEYESPDCENRRPTYKYHRGGEALVLNSMNGGSDGALILLTGSIPEDWDVYFNGWDRGNDRNLINSGSIIHHPNGALKKISLFEENPANSTWTNGAPDAYWELGYTEGATFKGSSGGPLFNQNGLVIGTLTGGNNSCSNPAGRDIYGKFWYHWDQATDTDLHMSKYLDPLNSGKASLAGLNNNNNETKELILDKTNVDIISNTNATVEILSGNGNYRVASSDNNIATAEMSNSQILIKAHKLGSAVITITDGKNKTKEVAIIVRNNIDYYLKDNTMKTGVYSEDDVIKQVRIIDMDGDVFYNKKNIDEKNHDIDMSQFRKGLYIIQIITQKSGKKSEKFLW